MKTRILCLSKLALCLLTVCPAIVSAAPPSTSPYYTDASNSYVQDQTTQAMSSLNGTLCYINAMAPAQMVNLGNYIALIDSNTCYPNVDGGQAGSTSSGADYQSVIVNSSRVDNNSPMIAKLWIDEPALNLSSFVHLAATQAPDPITDPYGRFRMDYCGITSTNSNCPNVGYINSTASGLDFFQYYAGTGYTYEMKLKLNATGNSAGSGALSQTFTGAGMPAPSAFTFAYNADYFRRSDGTGAGDLCFDRSAANAAESVWSYGLYDETSGARIEHNTGFPIEYTDLATQTTMSGYVGYWGMSAQTQIDTNKPVYQVTYNNSGATKTPYTLMQTGGKLTKYTQISKKLSDLDKIKFQFWASADVPGVSVAPATPTTLTAHQYYEVYWDDTNTTFQITGQQDSVTHNIVPYATPVPLTIANMVAAAPYSISASSNMIGGSFTITSSLMASLGRDTPVRIRTQDIVYPSEFTALVGMKCINNCPTAAAIDASNLAPTNAPVSPFESTTVGWAFSPGKALYSYTLNPATGNLMDEATAPVVSTATTGNNAWGVNSGRLIATADLPLLNAAVVARTGSAANNYTQADIDALSTYYEWHTGGNSWNQLSILKDTYGAPVRFDPPLNVNFTVPNVGAADVAKYGTAAGATITLQYGGFGNLWGIPSSCVDSVTNTACVFSGGSATAATNQRWTPEFSIPTGSIVTTGATNYLVKALQKEIRLANVPLATCDAAGLAVPVLGAITLPGDDPTTATTAKSIGAIPTFNPQPAPRVIHGVKMY